MAMTAAMRRMHRHLPPDEQYALPPREIIQGLPDGHSGARQDEDTISSRSILAHFAYGATTGALFGLLEKRSIITGVWFGIGVWTASYLGWIPAAGILVPATRHPMRRNALMLAAHVVWGAALAAGLREIEEAGRGPFRHRGNALRDVSD